MRVELSGRRLYANYVYIDFGGGVGFVNRNYLSISYINQGLGYTKILRDDCDNIIEKIDHAWIKIRL